MDWISYIAISLIGIFLAYITIIYTDNSFTFDKSLIGVFGSYSPPIIYFTIFSKKRKMLQDEKNSHHKQIALLNESLEQKVVERTNELEKALAAKTEFLNNMSHEIRTPIQGFTTISAGLEEHWDDFNEAKRKILVSEITNNAKRLSSLIGNLLDLSKFSAGKMLLELRQFDMKQAIEDIIEECRALYINGKHLEIKFTAEIDSSNVVADQERISQVLRNLFINAIKFSPDNSNIFARLIEIKSIDTEGKKINLLRFSITDQGVGIPEEELSSIFNPFTQSSRTKTKAGGTGLGLSIAKEIIDTHNGRIWAERNREKGASFNFELPITEGIYSTTQQEGKNHLYINPSKSCDRAANIMIIDDEESCLTSMELLLHGTNYNLIKEKGGKEALDYLSNGHDNIDLIMLDLMMPDMYGLNVLASLKSDPKLCTIPIILQTGTSDNAEIEKAYNMGIICHIKKPYQKQIVLQEIKKTLSKED